MYELENVITAHLENVKLPSSTNNNLYSGYVDGEEKYNSFLTGLNAAGFSFSTRTSLSGTKSKGRIFFKKSPSTKSQHEVSIPFFGSPFQVVRSAHLQCVQGEKYFKSRAHDVVSGGLDQSPLTKQRSLKLSKKFGCPAFLSMKCIRVFDEPQYMLSVRGSHSISKVSDLLQNNLMKKSTMPTSFLRFLILLSPSEAHSHGVSGDQPLHPKLKEAIRRLVHDNITCVKNVKLDLLVVVKDMFDESKLPPPDPGNRCFYPTDKMIRNHVQLTLYEMKKSRFDEKDLGRCVESWRNARPDDRIFFRPSKTRGESNEEADANGSMIVFCHQTPWQRDLLVRYGNNVSLLDPAYKTVKYSLPLYFVVVKTNCGYSVVGTFVVYDDTSALIGEALSVFASWNPEWEPKYFMTDFSEAEINAVKQNFPLTTVYVCVFHREQTWERWLQKVGHVSADEEQTVKKLWRDVATSISEEEYQVNLDLMNTNEIYRQCPLAKCYFTQKWLVCHESWVLAYHTTEFLSTLNINNGMEAQKKILKHSFLRFSSNKTIPGILRIVIEEFLPESLKSYRLSNVKLNADLGREYGEEMSAFLRDKTKSFVAHFKDESNKALNNYDIEKIIDMSGVDSDGLFYVKSESEECYYIVDFQTATCSCSRFTKWQFPCRHMCALFIYTDWSFDRLPSTYKDSPYITVDDKHCTIAPEVSGRVSEPNDSAGQTSETTEMSVSTIDDDNSRKRQSADLIDAREKLKRVLCYTYRMDAADPSSQDFCRRVDELEAETLTSLQRLERVVTVRPFADAVGVKMPPLQLLRKKYTELPGSKRSDVLKAVGRVVSVSEKSPHGLCYEIDLMGATATKLERSNGSDSNSN